MHNLFAEHTRQMYRAANLKLPNQLVGVHPSMKANAISDLLKGIPMEFTPAPAGKAMSQADWREGYDKKRKAEAELARRPSTAPSAPTATARPLQQPPPGPEQQGGRGGGRSLFHNFFTKQTQ
mmetsp:Transcript_4435/g.6947  ORF Transcript_4435/g.6947 Transcript_4435/m.6947 type:complete len:123 (+) Transcript_4435:480-848(+)